MIGDRQEPYGQISFSFILLNVSANFFNLTQIDKRTAMLLKLVCEGFVTSSQKLYKTNATYDSVRGCTMLPSLILHGRTEIKARGVGLGGG